MYFRFLYVRSYGLISVTQKVYLAGSIKFMLIFEYLWFYKSTIYIILELYSKMAYLISRCSTIWQQIIGLGKIENRYFMKTLFLNFVWFHGEIQEKLCVN